jgi:hypothetical protein
MNSIRAKVLLTSLSALTAVVFIAATATFAWFNFNTANNNSVVTTAGNIEISSFNATAYKFVYPTFNSNSSSSASQDSTSTEPVYDYDNPNKGTVTAYDLKTQNVKMNKYDPFYLSLNPDLTVDYLNTNLVIQFDITVTTYTNATLNINAIRLNSTTWPTGSYRASDYLDFWLGTDASAATIASASDYSYSRTYGMTTTFSRTCSTVNDKTFFAMKNIEDTTHINSSSDYTHFYTTYADKSSDTKMVLYTNSADLAYTNTDGSAMSVTKTVYLNIDYNQSNLSSFTAQLTADETISLGMDYYFQIEAIQR